jgi:hypothetical protein
MRGWILCLMALSSLSALGGCRSSCSNHNLAAPSCASCGNRGGCSTCGHGGNGDSRRDQNYAATRGATACWHGICDCQPEDYCCTRQPWIVNCGAHATPPVPAIVPAPGAPPVPMVTTNNPSGVAVTGERVPAPAPSTLPDDR